MKTHPALSFLAVALLSVCPVLFSSCATSFGLWSPNVTITSIPTGAALTVDGRVAGVTPLKLWLDAARPHQIVAVKDDWTQTAALVLPAADGRPPRLFIWDEGGNFSELVNFDPGTVDLWLKSSVNGDRFAGFVHEVALAAALEKAGKLSAIQHHELERAIREFFVPPESLADN
jgi:hypothetical protein